MIFQDHVRDFTVERFYGEYCWDGIRPQVRGWTIRRSWLHHIRDDTIENDGCLDGRLDSSFLDGVHTFYSARLEAAVLRLARHNLEFVGNLLSLGCGLPNRRACEDRAKRLQYAWSAPWGSGQAFKTSGGGGNTILTFRDNTVMVDLDVGINVSRGGLSLISYP